MFHGEVIRRVDQRFWNVIGTGVFARTPRYMHIIIAQFDPFDLFPGGCAEEVIRFQ